MSAFGRSGTHPAQEQAAEQAAAAQAGAGTRAGALDVTRPGGVLFVAPAEIACYAATAMNVQGQRGRTTLPIRRPSAAAAVTGRHHTAQIHDEQGMPGGTHRATSHSAAEGSRA